MLKVGRNYKLAGLKSARSLLSGRPIAPIGFASYGLVKALSFGLSKLGEVAIQHYLNTSDPLLPNEMKLERRYVQDYRKQI